MDCAAASTTEPSDELADTSPVIAEATDCSAVCSELKVDCRLFRSDCWLCNELTSFCSSCIGREAMDTARCKTCWKELEKVLWPENVIALDAELLAELVVPISDCFPAK